MDIKKLPFYMVGLATLTSIALSLVGVCVGFFHVLAEPPAKDTLTGTVLILTCTGTFLVTTYLLYLIRGLYLRVFPKQDNTEQESGE